MTDGAPHGYVPLAAAARFYLLLLPVGQLVVFPLGGAIATGSDLALGGLLAAGLVAEVGPRLGGAPPVALRVPVSLVRAVGLFAAFGAWAALSGLWGFHPRYAGFKGLAYLALSAGVWLVARSGVGFRGLARAWLTGCGLALAITLVASLLGPPGLRAWVLYEAGAVRGLPLPRVSGPFLHPSLFGGYLAVSGALLWGAWPELSHGWRRAAGTMGAVGLVVLVLTISTGWVAAGVAAILVGRDSSLNRRPGLSLALRGGGALLAAVALAGVLVPLSLDLGPWTIRSGAVRPAIWRSALGAVLSSPVVGVGASPFLAEAPDPAAAQVLHLWDAHQAYLSVLGQFGIVGAILLGGGITLLVRALFAAPPSRERAAVLVALAAVAAHGFLVASEDFRHVWGLLGVAAALVAEGARRGGDDGTTG